MARPRKNNADWFPHDATMRNDPKIRAVRSKFGNEGYAVWCYLLETLTDADGFELEWSELNRELLAGDFGVSTVETLEAIVAYLGKVQLVALEGSKLTCPNLKVRLSPVLAAREKASKHYQNKVSITETPVSTVETPQKEKESILTPPPQRAGAENDFLENGDEGVVLPPVAPPPPTKWQIYEARLSGSDDEIRELCRISKVPDKPFLLEYLRAYVKFKSRKFAEPFEYQGFKTDFVEWIPSEQKKRADRAKSQSINNHAPRQHKSTADEKFAARVAARAARPIPNYDL